MCNAGTANRFGRYGNVGFVERFRVAFPLDAFPVSSVPSSQVTQVRQSIKKDGKG